MASKMEVGVRLVTTEAVNSFLVFTSGGDSLSGAQPLEQIAFRRGVTPPLQHPHW